MVVAALGALYHEDGAVPAIHVELLVSVVVLHLDLLFDLLLDGDGAVLAHRCPTLGCGVSLVSLDLVRTRVSVDWPAEDGVASTTQRVGREDLCRVGVREIVLFVEMELLVVVGLVP